MYAALSIVDYKKLCIVANAMGAKIIDAEL